MARSPELTHARDCCHLDRSQRDRGHIWEGQLIGLLDSKPCFFIRVMSAGWTMLTWRMCVAWRGVVPAVESPAENERANAGNNRKWGCPLSVVRCQLRPGYEANISNRQSSVANKGRFLWLWPQAGLCLAAFVVLCLSCSPSFRQGADAPLTELQGGVDPLRDAFNKDVGKVRLMLLLDPT